MTLLGCSSSQGEGFDRADIFVVKRGALPIEVTEQAEIQPHTSTRIKNEMEGQVDDHLLDRGGDHRHRTGQKLVELDASEPA